MDGLTGRVGAKVLLKRTTWRGAGGQLWALIGPNGAGKSTFLSLIAGIGAEGLRSEGQVDVGESPLAGLAPRARATLLAYLPQDPETPATLTVRETVLLGRAPYRSAFAGTSEDDAAQVDAALARLELDALQDRLPATLSGGERQRMHLARILAQDARILLLDEPYGHLDFAHQAKLLRLLAEIALERLVVIVAHDLFFLPRIATHFALLRDGEMIAQGPTADVWTPEEAERAFGLPFVRDGARVLPA